MQTQNETLKPKDKICDSNNVVLLHSVDGEGFHLSQGPVRSEFATKQLMFTSVILCTYILCPVLLSSLEFFKAF